MYPLSVADKVIKG